jgi:hypothetical protein
LQYAKALSYIGITVKDKEPYVSYQNGQGDVIDVREIILVASNQLNAFQQLINVGKNIKSTKGTLPNLLFVVLPDSAGEIYTKVKQ